MYRKQNKDEWSGPCFSLLLCCFNRPITCPFMLSFSHLIAILYAEASLTFFGRSVWEQYTDGEEKTRLSNENNSNEKKTQTKKILNNRKAKDNGAKLIFGNPTLCAQFLRGYTDIDLLKNVQPEDIEDISERFLPMFQEGRDSDSVKKVHLEKQSLYLITIIEHQSSVHYDMAFKLLRYIVMVLTDYESEQERLHEGITKTKNFKYPPVLPIVYYEGTENWTAVRNFRDRVHLSDVLGKYIPDFEYEVIPLVKYSNQDLFDKEDELSLIMLINKLRDSSQFGDLKEIPKEYLAHLEKNTPDHLLRLMGKIISVLLYRLNVPREEVEEFTDLIERRQFEMLFDSFEAYDVQETRRISHEEGRTEGLAEGHAMGLLDGKRESVLELLKDYGKIPKELRERILAETDLTILGSWVKAASKADTVEEFQKATGL